MMVARSGAAQALVLLAQYPNDDLREAAAVALWDLCYDCQAGREAVVRAGEEEEGALSVRRQVVGGGGAAGCGSVAAGRCAGLLR